MNNLNEAMTVFLTNINNGIDNYLPKACEELLKGELIYKYMEFGVSFLFLVATVVGAIIFTKKYLKVKNNENSLEYDNIENAFFMKLLWLGSVVSILCVISTGIDIYQIINLPNGWLLDHFKG